MQWNVYRDPDHDLVFDADGDGVEDGMLVHCKQCTICKSAGLAIVDAAVLLVIYIWEPNAVWNALA